MVDRSIYIGFDPREAAAFAVARYSIRRHLTQAIPIHGLVLSDLMAKGLYTRPIEFRRSAADRPIMWDTISEAPMSTQHAIARFLVKYLAKTGWAMFCDGDVLFRDNAARLFDGLDNSIPLYCVKHNHYPSRREKMDGQVQLSYPKKNWSSVFVINTQHEANAALTLKLINTLPGRDLHGFCWLDESEIGELPAAWNYLVGETNPPIDKVKLAHFTNGVPDMIGYENQLYADEWREELARWAA